MHRPIFAILTIIIIGFISTLAAHDSLNHTTVKHFDLSRYLGIWHEIARFDNRFERNLTCVTAHYMLLDNGEIKVTNSGYNTKKKEWTNSIGRARTTSTIGRLRVSFFLFFYSDYNILALGESSDDTPYEWALVGSKSDDLLWILAREKQLSGDTFAHIIEIANSKGYDTDDLLILEPCNK